MGDGSMDIVGFDVEVVSKDFKVLDPVKAGSARSSVQIFEYKRGSKDMESKLSSDDAAIGAPDRVAATGDGSLVATNHHSEGSKPSNRVIGITG